MAAGGRGGLLAGVLVLAAACAPRTAVPQRQGVLLVLYNASGRRADKAVVKLNGRAWGRLVLDPEEGTAVRLPGPSEPTLVEVSVIDVDGGGVELGARAPGGLHQVYTWKQAETWLKIYQLWTITEFRVSLEDGGSWVFGNTVESVKSIDPEVIGAFLKVPSPAPEKP